MSIFPNFIIIICFYAVTNSDSMAGMPFKLVVILFIPMFVFCYEQGQLIGLLN